MPRIWPVWLSAFEADRPTGACVVAQPVLRAGLPKVAWAMRCSDADMFPSVETAWKWPPPIASQSLTFPGMLRLLSQKPNMVISNLWCLPLPGLLQCPP